MGRGISSCPGVPGPDCSVRRIPLVPVLGVHSGSKTFEQALLLSAPSGQHGREITPHKHCCCALWGTCCIQGNLGHLWCPLSKHLLPGRSRGCLWLLAAEEHQELQGQAS